MLRGADKFKFTNFFKKSKRYFLLQISKFTTNLMSKTATTPWKDNFRPEGKILGPSLSLV